MDSSRSSHQVLKFAPADQVPRAYSFGAFQFDPHDRVLYRDGVTVPLTPKAAELLLLFVQSRGRLLSKETLILSLWGETFVEESSLTQTVFLLRKALGPEPYVETVPRRGYRFTPPVEHIDSLTSAPIPPGPARIRRSAAGVAALALALVVVATFAVGLRHGADPPVVAGELIPANISPQGREAYLKGRYYWNRRTVPDFHKALDQFRAATEREPQFALAWAGLADTYNFLGQAPRAKIAAQRALEIDETCAPAHAALGVSALFYYYDWPTADRSLSRAVELDPSYASAHHWRAFLLVSQRRFAEARMEIERARELDPLSKIIETDVGVIHYFSRDFDRAIAHYRRALELDPTFEQAHATLVSAYLAVGDVDRATSELALTRQGFGGELALLCARGETAKARARLAELEKRDPNGRNMSDYGMATSFVAAGDPARALTWLTRAYDAHDGDIALLHADPRLDSIRDDPRFIEFVRGRGLGLR